jgi:hypothetical protein
MKRVIFLFLFSVLSSQFSIFCFPACAQINSRAKVTRHLYPDCTVYEYLPGQTVSAGVWCEEQGTYVDTAWVGEPAYVFSAKVGIQMSDRALNGLKQAIQDYFDCQGQIEYVLPDGTCGISVSSSSVNWIWEQLKLDYRNVQIDGVYEWKEEWK